MAISETTQAGGNISRTVQCTDMLPADY